MDDSTCIFCRIAAGEAPAYVVWTDTEHFAFLDRSPVAPGHVVVIPRTHAPTGYDLDAGAYERLFARVRALAKSTI